MFTSCNVAFLQVRKKNIFRMLRSGLVDFQLLVDVKKYFFAFGDRFSELDRDFAW